MRRFVDIVLLAVACYLVYFGYLNDHPYIKTEGLRAIVVHEMLERDGFTMPTVHHKPYLNKPPLAAWTTTWLARQLGRFDEQVARLPSAVAGTALVLLMYGLGESWIRRGAGLAAGVFTLLCPTVADYAVRAELDMPFTFLCTCNIVLVFAALRRRGWPGAVLWLAAYLFALLAAMWKGPHSLIFMWLTLLGRGWLRRDWSWRRAPAQWIGLAAALGVLVWWTRALSAFAGAAQVGNTAAIELLARLLPHRGEHLLEILTFIPMLLIVTLPASVFVAMTFSRRVRHALTGDEIIEPPSRALPVRLGAFVTGWWRWMGADDRRILLAAWLVPSLAFMLWAPAKAARYCLPIMPPLLALAAMVAVRLEDDHTGDGKGPKLANAAWRGLFCALGLASVCGVVGLVLALTGRNASAEQSTWVTWGFLIVGGIIPLVVELGDSRGRSLRTRLILCLIGLLAWQPVLHNVLWAREASQESQQETAEQIDQLVSQGARLYVLGVHEYHNVAIYAQTPFEFADSLDDALVRARLRDPQADRAYAIFRAEEAEELTAGAQARHTVLFRFDKLRQDNVCVEIRPAEARIPPG